MSNLAHALHHVLGKIRNIADDKFLVALIIIFMIPRFVWSLTIPVEPLSDSHAYDTFARNIVNYGVFGWQPDQPAAYWPVGTSAIIALLYFLFGPSYVAIVVLNIVVSFLNMLLVYSLSRYYFNRDAGRYAGIIYAIWPGLIMYSTIIASELIFMMFCLLTLWVWERRSMPVLSRLFLFGLFVAAASYVRPIALLIPLVLVTLDIIRNQMSARQALRSILIPTIVMVVCIGPWTYRNYLVFGEPEIISTNFGPTLWMGNNPETNGGYQSLPSWTQDLSETERARRLQDEAIAYILDEPAAFVWRTLVKFVRLHERETIPVVWNRVGIEENVGRFALMPLKILSTTYWWMVLFSACWGVVLIMRREGLIVGVTHPAITLWLYFTGIHAVIITGDRYHMPASPFIAMLAGVAVASAAEWLDFRARGRLDVEAVGRRTAS